MGVVFWPGGGVCLFYFTQDTFLLVGDATSSSAVQ